MNVRWKKEHEAKKQGQPREGCEMKCIGVLQENRLQSLVERGANTQS